jgi:hypothetical protein
MAQAPTPPAKPAQHEGARKEREETPIGAKPKDPHDPQAEKFDPPVGPPNWTPPKEAPEPEPPAHTIADEQRERAALIEKEGMAKYVEDVDERSDEDKPLFVQGVLAGSGAFLRREGTAGKQVPGVAPATKRS